MVIELNLLQKKKKKYKLGFFPSLLKNKENKENSEQSREET